MSRTNYTAFDILGRVTSNQQITDAQNYTTGYVYNLSSALIEETYPSGRVVKNTLDNDGNLSQVQSRKLNGTFQNYANSFNYTAAGAVSSMRLGNGKWESTQFNSRLQPTQIALGASAGNTNLLKLDYSYGTTANNGNVQTQTITVPTVGSNPGFTATQTYNYDSLNRIKDATENITGQTWKQAFIYDRYGNRNFNEALTTTMPKLCNNNTTVCPETVPIVNPSVNTANNRLNGYLFDSAGNTTRDAENRNFVYDAEDRQIEARNAQTQVIGIYVYDGDGKRVKKSVLNGETTIFVYDAFSKLISEYSTQTAQTPHVSYLTDDNLGTPRIITDENGTTIARHDFHPFGDEVIRANYGTDSIRKKFTTYERDTETNLDFAQARMYANRIGRFLVPDPVFSSVDPTNPQSWNRYSYCLNNPYSFVDPSGLIWVYQDSSDGTTRTFRWYDKEKDVPKDWTAYTGSNYFIGKDEAIFLGAKGKSEKISVEQGALGQLDEFLRGPDSPLTKEEKEKLNVAFLERVRKFHWEDDFIASLAGSALGSLSHSGLRGLAALFTTNAARVETATLSGMLREAVAGKGDFGIGSATVDQATALGRAWVGKGYSVARDGVTLISQDGLRQFRPPSFKPNLGKVQANLEWRMDGLKQWQGNGHIDILP